MGVRTRDLDIAIGAKRQVAETAARAEAKAVIERWKSFQLTSMRHQSTSRAGTTHPGERRKTKPLGAALALKAAGTALHHRPEEFDDRTRLTLTQINLAYPPPLLVMGHPLRFGTHFIPAIF
jgi:hypothetical protein